MLNKVELIGNIGQTPELIETANGTQLVNLSIATNSNKKNSSGEYESVTEWHNVTVFGATAVNICKYQDKGNRVYIEGRLQTRSYEDREGNKRYKTEIIAYKVLFLDKKGTASGNTSTARERSPAKTTKSFDDLPF